MNLEGCYRCKNKEAVFSCLNCETFKLLCTQCDSYVHGLPSKSKHRRTTMNKSEGSSKNPMLINDNHKENFIEWNSRFNFSQIPKNEEFNEEKQNKIVKIL